MITGTSADKFAKAIVAAVGTAQAAYTTASVTGHMSWLALVGCLFSGASVGLLTWAVPNAPAEPIKVPTP